MPHGDIDIARKRGTTDAAMQLSERISNDAETVVTSSIDGFRIGDLTDAIDTAFVLISDAEAVTWIA